MNTEIAVTNELSLQSTERQVLILPNPGPEPASLRMVIASKENILNMTLEEIWLNESGKCEVIAFVKKDGSVIWDRYANCGEGRIYDNTEQLLTDLNSILLANGLDPVV